MVVEDPEILNGTSVIRGTRRNSFDFRGPTDAPGSPGQHADVPIHAGLVCINGPEQMNAKTEATGSLYTTLPGLAANKVHQHRELLRQT